MSLQIVVEYVLLENLLINLIVLNTTALLTKEKGKLFLLSSFLSACVAVVIPMCYLSTLGSFLLQIGVAILNVCLCFKFKGLKKFFQLYLCYFITLFIYGGACFFFESLFGIESILIVLAIVVVVFFTVKFLMKRYTRKKAVECFCYDVQIEMNGKKTDWKAFLDSGNLLYDPLTENPVTIINFKVFSTIFEDIELSVEVYKMR